MQNFYHQIKPFIPLIIAGIGIICILQKPESNRHFLIAIGFILIMLTLFLTPALSPGR